MKCYFFIKSQSRIKSVAANVSGCLDIVFCQDRPAQIERSAWIHISWSASKGCERFCPDVFFGLDAQMDLPGYCQDTIRHPGRGGVGLMKCLCLRLCSKGPDSRRPRAPGEGAAVLLSNPEILVEIAFLEILFP
jgi:hypothetical protein